MCVLDVTKIDEIVTTLTKNVDEALKESKKKWSQAISLRLFYSSDVITSNAILSSALVSEILKRSSTAPAITTIPVSALGSKGESLIACVLHIV